MSSFRFNFSGDNDLSNEKDDAKEIHWLESEEIVPTDQIKKIDEIVHAKMFTCGNIEIGHVVAKEALLNCTENAIDIAETEHSDLIVGKYEGGLKIWECTTDLIEYLYQHKDEIQLENAKVLDLGCGAGILGIYAFMHGSLVTFQDYNKVVLEHVTIPNVLLNIEEEERETEIVKCKFYSGDWSSFENKLPCSEVYDLIFTSETIYNISNYTKLIDLFIKRLSDKGVVYVAAKTYYFGVGGGTRQFEQSIQKNGNLKSEICWTSTGGIQREILKVTKKS